MTTVCGIDVWEDYSEAGDSTCSGKCSLDGRTTVGEFMDDLTGPYTLKITDGPHSWDQDCPDAVRSAKITSAYAYWDGYSPNPAKFTINIEPTVILEDGTPELPGFAELIQPYSRKVAAQAWEEGYKAALSELENRLSFYSLNHENPYREKTK